MKYLLFTLFLGLYAPGLLAQQPVIMDTISEGIKLHDQGRYEDAIAKYKSALKLDSNYAEVYYETSYSLFALKRYDEAISYSRKAIEKNFEDKQGCYIIIGSCFDLKGKPDESIRVLEEGIKDNPKSNLLYYNLAVTCFNNKYYEKSQKASSESILLNPKHANSHKVLANTMDAQNSRIRTILPLYFQLLFDTDKNSARASLMLLKKLLNSGASENADGKGINIMLSDKSMKDSLFSATELFLSLSAGLNKSKKNEGKSKIEQFINQSELILSTLRKTSTNNDDRIWNWYVSKYSDLEKNKLCDVFCYFILNNLDFQEAKTWLDANPDKVNQFVSWMKKI